MSAPASNSSCGSRAIIAAAPGSTLHVRAFAPYALPFLSLAVASALIWRSWTLARRRAIPFALIGLVGAFDGPRYDVIIAPTGEQAALRDADGRLAVLGKRFNAFAAEQWLAADGDGREPPQRAIANAPCDRFGCVGALPEGQSLALVEDRMAFEEDCARADDRRQPADARRRVARRNMCSTSGGSPGPARSASTWRTALRASRPTASPLEDRPWSPAPKRPRSDRVQRPGKGAPMRADPADPDRGAALARRQKKGAPKAPFSFPGISEPAGIT